MICVAFGSGTALRWADATEAVVREPSARPMPASAWNCSDFKVVTSAQSRCGSGWKHMAAAPRVTGAGTTRTGRAKARRVRGNFATCVQPYIVARRCLQDGDRGGYRSLGRMGEEGLEPP